MTEKPESDREPRPRNAQGYAGQVVSQLQGTYQSGVPSARATMAQLRRLDPATDEGVLEVMSIAFADPPEEILGTGGDCRGFRPRPLLHPPAVEEPIHARSRGRPWGRGAQAREPG